MVGCIGEDVPHILHGDENGVIKFELLFDPSKTSNHVVVLPAAKFASQVPIAQKLVVAKAGELHVRGV